MIQNHTSIYIDQKGRELREQNLPSFNFAANEGDVHQYIASRIAAHWHRELELFCLLEGNVRIGIENETYEISAGEGCFINSGVLHSFAGYLPAPCHYRSFVFDPDIIGGAPGSVFDIAYMKPLMEEGGAFLKFADTGKDQPFFQKFDQIFQICENECPGYEFLVRNVLSDIILYIKQTSPLQFSRNPETAQEKRIKLLLNWLEEHLTEPISLNDISASAGISPRECQRIFRQYLHRSPMEYLQWKRILTAAEKLASTDEDITTIALSCGFCSPSYFSKKFKEFTGNPPREYRAMLQAQPDVPYAGSARA